MRIGEPTHADTLYAEVAVDHFVRWMGVAQRENKHGKDDSTSRSQRLQLVRRFFEIVVSGYGTQHIIVRDMSLMDELADIIVDTMVQPQFPTPSGKNRTKTGPAADRVFYGMQCGIILSLARLGPKKLEFQKTLTTKDGDADVELDTSFASWNEVAGQRKVQTFTFLSNVANLIILIIFIITDESSRYITHQLLYWSHKTHDTRGVGEPTAHEYFLSTTSARPFTMVSATSRRSLMGHAKKLC